MDYKFLTDKIGKAYESSCLQCGIVYYFKDTNLEELKTILSVA